MPTREVIPFISLEPKLLEEVTRSGSLLLAGDLLLVQVTFLENLLQVLLDLHLLLAHEIGLVDRLLQVHIHLVAGGEDVAYVDVLNERLHGFAPLLDLLLGHAAGDLARSAGDAGDEAMGEALVVRVALFHVLDDDGLLTGVTTGEDDNDFSRLDDCHSLLLCSSSVMKGDKSFVRT
jgi:hypothetical protein